MARSKSLWILLLSTLLLPYAATAQDAPPAAPSAGAGAVPAAEKLIVKEGDVVAGIGADGIIRVMKVAKINFQNGDRILHCVVYKESFKSVADAKAAYDRKAHFTVETAHLPVDGEGLAPDLNKVLGNEAVTKADRAGYDAYVHEMGR